jgi:hypothetical protein
MRLDDSNAVRTLVNQNLQFMIAQFQDLSQPKRLPAQVAMQMVPRDRQL